MNTVLVVEDNRADVALIRHAFHEHPSEFSFTSVDSMAAAKLALTTDKPDLLITDLQLPDGSGMELISFARACGCPTIVLTGRGNEAFAVKALRSGALDYVVKSGAHIADIPHIASRVVREWQNLVELERTTRLLSESEERFRTFAELAADWFWETDDSMRITFLSPEFCRFSSTDPERLIGMPLKETFAACKMEFDWPSFEQAWHKHTEIDLELISAVAGQPVRTVGLRGIAFFSDAGVFRGYRGIGRDITNEREVIRQITHLAMHDPLTDILNRRSVESVLKSVLLELSHGPKNHVFCYLDLDNFKHVNDTFGHLAGDIVLKQVVAAISKQIRAGDHLGRIGGDEFAILLKHCPLEFATEITEKIIASIANTQIKLDQGQTTRVTASVGVMPLQADYSITRVFRESDRVCYLAKRAGGNRCMNVTQSPSADPD